jgi:nucleotide-binding universal stress UspA family protein
LINEVLVCLEGSPSSDAATRVALGIARALRAKLVGLAIVDEPDIRAGTPTSIGGASFKHERDEALIADARQHAADWLALFERRCREAGVEARTLEVVGRPAQSILAEMQTRDLTIMGRDANFRFETESDDHKTREAILHGATRPILLVPEPVPDPNEAVDDLTGARLVERAGLGKVVVIAYDGSRAAKRALESFAGSGLARGREVHVATVDDDGAIAWEMAKTAVEMLDALDVAAKPHNIVSVLSNTEALFKFAAEVGAGIMVMGAFAHSRLAALFSGSVTRGLVERATIPLYLQH